MKPTMLDKMQDPDLYDDEQDQAMNNPDNVYEPDCNVVMEGCLAEMIAILTYLAVLFVVGSMMYIQVQ